MINKYINLNENKDLIMIFIGNIIDVYFLIFNQQFEKDNNNKDFYEFNNLIKNQFKKI